MTAVAIPSDQSGAIVSDIQRMSTEDGPGIRTTVFFKGCPLSCRWCHNPESISLRPQVQWIGPRCIGCHTCIETCKNHALTVAPDGGIRRDRRACRVCGECVEACPARAMDMVGKEWHPNDLVSEVIKDRAFFEASGGGITASGGEPAVQAGFVSHFFATLKETGIHTALDTCGMCSREALLSILPHADMVMYDLKLSDPEKHRVLTGASTDQIIKNLLAVRDHMKAHNTPKTLWIRTPIIPDATATDENIHGIGQLISSELGDAVGRWELCSFNNLCKDKYARLDMEWSYKDCGLLTAESMAHCADIARSSVKRKDIIHWSGLTRNENAQAPEAQQDPLLSLRGAANSMSLRGT